MLGLLVAVTVATAGAVGIIATHRVAQAAADLAALAGASAVQEGGDPCGQAARVADRNRATLLSCEVAGWNVTVVVSADTARLPGGVLDLRARARAGPAVGDGRAGLSAPGR